VLFPSHCFKFFIPKEYTCHLAQMLYGTIFAMLQILFYLFHPRSTPREVIKNLTKVVHLCCCQCFCNFARPGSVNFKPCLRPLSNCSPISPKVPPHKIRHMQYARRPISCMIPLRNRLMRHCSVMYGCSVMHRCSVGMSGLITNTLPGVKDCIIRA
jgi:hypothetical protein